jgi:hypothetical protein
MGSCRRAGAALAAATAAVVGVGGTAAGPASASVSAARPASAAAGCSARPVQPKPAGTDSLLLAVDVVSKCDAWAVGGYTGGSIIEHWTGRSWKRMKVTDHQATLNGVVQLTATRAWATGYYDAGSNEQPVILSWSGHSWTSVKVPDPGGTAASNDLNAIAASSAGNAWAVGYTVNTKDQQLPFTLHYAHGSWHHITCPLPAGGSHALLKGVAIEPDGSAWAVGDYYTGTAFTSLVEHWVNGKWHVVSAPVPAGADLEAVSAAGPGRAFAAGSYNAGSTFQPLSLEYRNGAWKRLKTPPLADGGELEGVTAASATSAWAVGYADTTAGTRTVMLSWNGSKWHRLTTANPVTTGEGNVLTAVSGTSCSNLWAVGWDDPATVLVLTRHAPAISNLPTMLTARC